MSKKIKIELISDGVKRLLKSQEMQNVCKTVGLSVANRCGKGYAVGTHVADTRAYSVVYAASNTAKLDNSRNNTLLKAVSR